ncbi:MAG: hypothetical protein AAFX93_19485 [Verrucomicrobiota bacterium]
MKPDSQIERVLDQADSVDLQEGLEAYFNYHRTLKLIADEHGIDVRRVCGCFAALSPNSDYFGNLRSTLTLCIGFANGLKSESCTVTTYNVNREKAWRILNGEHFFSVFRGLKVRNFFLNLSEPDHPEAVTIDGHMMNVVHGSPRTMHQSSVTPSGYVRVAKAFSRVAAKRGMLPSQSQAIAWFTWKRIHNIVYDGQVDMFREGNQWRNFVPIEEIKPFRISA